MPSIIHASKWLTLLVTAFWLGGCNPHTEQGTSKNTIPLVKNGQATSAIILPKNQQAHLREIAADFVGTVKRATQVSIPIIPEDQEAGLDPAVTRIFLGETQQTRAEDIFLKDVPEEAYRLLARPGSIFILGNDSTNARSAHPRTQPTRWALNRLLEEGLGVRWLWPGELGTYVPTTDSFAVPPADTMYQPQLVRRQLSLVINRWPLSANPATDAKLRQEAAAWSENHLLGKRDQQEFNHAFEGWWKKYGKEHPELFAVPPPGITQPYSRPDRVKLRLGNPAVIEQIAKEYTEAGAPEFWNVCPNDGSGFDLSAETRAWDIPQDLNPEKIWQGEANLTPRFVKFWNLLSERLQQINPEATLNTYAYAAYRQPPPAERPLTAAASLMIVCGYHDFDMWTDWSRQPGVRSVFLRPNWGHLAAHAPHLPLQETHKFMEFCWENKMKGVHIDSLLGYWATQGSLYYLWARLLTRPDLTLDNILEEYTAAFGAAAPLIRQYLDYWQDITTKIAIIDPYAYETASSAHGLFAKLVKEGKTRVNFVYGSRLALPYLYTEDVIAPAQALLDQALAKVGTTDRAARERVLFLQSGLDELRRSRDLYALMEKTKKRSPEDLQKLQEASDAVVKFREQLSPTHAIWGNRITEYENNYKVPVRPANIAAPAPNLQGM